MEQKNLVRSERVKSIIKVIALALLLVIISLIFFDSSMTLISKWLKFTESYGHGFLVLYIIFFEIYKKSSELKFTKPTLGALVFSILSSTVTIITWKLSLDYQVQLIEQLAVYTLWVLTIPLLFSFSAIRILWFPLFFFVFALPVWDQLNDLLVIWTSKAVSVMLVSTPVTFHLYDNVIELPFGTLIIADSCSGLRYLIVGAAMATYAAYTEKLTVAQGAAFIVIGVAVSILANWIRVMLLTVIGYYTKMESSLMTDHDNFGLILFFVLFFPLLLVITKKVKA